jgi:aminoglycoside 3-N-acetyltransferase
LIRTSSKKLLSIINQLDIKEGSYIMIHCSSFIFGKIEGGIDNLYNILKKNLGEQNTLIYPSFTYSFRRKEIFNISNTPCDNQIGILSEIARKDKISYRNNDPLFSLVATGKDKYIIERKKKSCFGFNSIYEKLFKKNFFILSLGVEFTNGISEFMHIEKLAKVPYRYDKIFKGISVSKENIFYNDYANHFVRNESFFKKFKQNRENFGNKLIKKKIIKKFIYGYGQILLIDGRNFLDYTFNELQKNKLLMVDKIK